MCGIEGNEGVLEEIKRPRLLNISDLCPCGFSIASLLLYGSPLLPVDILYESGSIHIYIYVVFVYIKIQWVSVSTQFPYSIRSAFDKSIFSIWCEKVEREFCV